MSEPTHSASILPPELMYLAPQGKAASQGIMQLAQSFTALNSVGVMLVYGLGLIMAASVLNVRRNFEREAAEAESLIVESAEAIRARKAGGRGFLRRPAGRDCEAQALLMIQLEDAVKDTGAGLRVTARPDLARIARPEGVSRRDWYSGLAALHIETPDLAVVDTEGALVAAVELKRSVTARTGIVDRMRVAAAARLGIPYAILAPDYPPAAIPALIRQAGAPRAAA